MHSRELLLSVIIPVHNGMRTLPSCLSSLKNSTFAGYECIVVDDGSTDESAAFAERWGARVLQTGGPFGPAHARNVGAKGARGEVLVFLDADVAVHPDTLARFAGQFAQDAAPDAVIGSYDDAPADPGLISSFKNLMHHYTHQHGKASAFSFWCGCGAVRTSVFFGQGGLDESYSRPSIEDIEFGLRMYRAGNVIVLDPEIQAKHLKRWTLWNLVKTDVLCRGIPWTELILRSGHLPDDLNLRWSQRISAAAAALSVAVLGATPWLGAWAAVASVGLLAMIAGLNAKFHVFLASRRGWGFSVAAFPVHVLYFLYSVVALIAGGVLFVCKRRRVLRAQPHPDGWGYTGRIVAREEGKAAEALDKTTLERCS